MGKPWGERGEPFGIEQRLWTSRLIISREEPVLLRTQQQQPSDTEVLGTFWSREGVWDDALGVHGSQAPGSLAQGPFVL